MKYLVELLMSTNADITFSAIVPGEPFPIG